MISEASPDVYQRVVSTVSDYDPGPLLSRLTMPTSAIHRRGYRGMSADLVQQFAAQLPDATLVMLDGDATWPGAGDVESFGRAVESFLGSTDEPTPTAAGGFQTILFTDLESSTALTQRLGDEGAQELLRGHNEAVRAALQEHGGREVKHTGDGTMASFPSAVADVTAALQMQRDLAPGLPAEGIFRS